MDLREQDFGVEIEMTGISRARAAEVAAEYLGGQVEYKGTYYDTYLASDRQGRKWKFTYDGSIEAQKKENGVKVSADDTYKTEMVTPICQYKDIPVIQELVRKLRRSGAFSNKSCGLHVHVSSAPFDARTLRNLTNIMYSKEDILYRALQVEVARENRYCKKTDTQFIDELNRRRPKTMEELSRVWYQGDSRSGDHYDRSRYRGVNLHSVFQKGTIEFRLYNSTVEHAGKIKAYIQLSLAITAQALNQHSASRIKTVSGNERYTFRTWLLRMGLIGDEFSTARKHLLENLDGNIAWRDPAQAQRQRERMQAVREQEYTPVPDFDYEQTEDEEQDSGPVMSM
ncbi:amidoligase family protein [Acutalibacter muris]|uniref:amidoligase family protein n=1 Tax=Acutalibacter muris TaxID=1796620 RepID=UPI001C3EB4A2|nr:amidoligase family protein [Acutalibacter muris]